MRSATYRSQNSPHLLSAPWSAVRGTRSAFTLVELMIAITILLLLTFITTKVIRSTSESDRVPGGARQVQSYLEGARDRAIYSTKTLNPGPRGVRFLRDPNNLNTVTSMVYIGPPQKFSDGLIEIGTMDGNVLNMRTIKPLNVKWENLELRKFLVSGARIEIPRGSGILYTIINTNTEDTIPPGFPGKWELTKDYPGSNPRSENYSLELEPAVLPNQEPRLLPRDVVIDVLSVPGQPEHSRIPGFWNGSFRNRMDILFSPRGTIVGRTAVGGYIHLVLTDLVDAEHGRFTGQSDVLDAQGNVIEGQEGKEGDEKIVTINTSTGSVTVHSVNPTDFNNDGIPEDPFQFAETGEE